MLERFTGPPCPRCGCTDSDVFAQPKAVDSAWPVPGMSKCNHCHYKFAFQAEEEESAESERPVYVPKARCPDCGKCDTYVASSPKPAGAVRIRYHKCNRCGKTFKTTGEADDEQPAAVRMSA